MGTLFLAAMASYLLGSVPCGYVLGRLKGVDLRRCGSGNVGATNTGRVLGRRFGVAAFAFDFCKGLACAFFLAGALYARGVAGWERDELALLLGGCAVLGHVFPIWLRFQGGKGVATSAGVCAGIHWPSLLAALAVWFVVLKLTRFMSVASMAGAVAFPLAFVLIAGPEVALGERWLVTVVAVVLAAAIIVLHRSNIGRLLRGEELRTGEARSGGNPR